MGNPLRVLIVEDSIDDALLMIRELEKGGYALVHERVETEEGMSSALQQKSWDLILCDYKLPRFNGLRALRRLQEFGKDIPFLIISGTIGEETAVEAMKAGAHDYIMKDKLQRLIPAVERELREAVVRRERRQSEDSVREFAQRWQTTFDAINDSVCILDLEGRILECNQATFRFLDKPTDKIIGRRCFELIHGVSVRIENGPVDRMLISKKRESLIIKLGDRWLNVTADPLFGETGRLTGAVHIISDITEYKQAEEEKQQSLTTLRKAMGGIIQAMALTVETRDPYTAGHQRRVADLAWAMASDWGLPEMQVDGIRMAGMVHDLGKISIPAEILSKPTQLNDLEFALIKIHPQVSYDILKDIEFPWPVAQIVFQHHERLNGSGYPLGLKGEKILIEARILAVADVVEAIASHRPYRPAYGIEVALNEITGKKGVLYDADVVEVCLRLFKEKGYVLE